MLKHVKNIGFVLILVSFLVAGCASSHRLKQDLPLDSRIGVVANFNDYALFQRAGTTSGGNVSFYRRVPELNVSALATRIVANHLRRSGQFKVISIYHRTETALLSAKVADDDVLTPEYRAYLSRLARRKRLDKIVLVVPGDIDFGDGQYFGTIWWVSGYGLFNHAFIFNHANTVFAAYNVYVIDMKNGKILARAKGSLQTRVHGVDVAWHKGYAGVTPSVLNKMRDVIRREMPASLTSIVTKTGLP